jgi:hypothetical protein
MIQNSMVLTKQENEEVYRQYEAFKIDPTGRDERHMISHTTKYIPYSSDKKDFMGSTGKNGFNGKQKDNDQSISSNTATVFKYTFQVPTDAKTYEVLWDFHDGLVRITPFFKACKYSKVNNVPPDITIASTNSSTSRRPPIRHSPQRLASKTWPTPSLAAPFQRKDIGSITNALEPCALHSVIRSAGFLCQYLDPASSTSAYRQTTQTSAGSRSTTNLCDVLSSIAGARRRHQVARIIPLEFPEAYHKTSTHPFTRSCVRGLRGQTSWKVRHSNPILISPTVPVAIRT